MTAVAVAIARQILSKSQIAGSQALIEAVMARIVPAGDPDINVKTESGTSWIDEAVVEEARGAVERVRLLVELLDDGLRTASVVTTEPTVCVLLTRWDFLAALREDVDMTIVILQELARRFRRALDAP